MITFEQADGTQVSMPRPQITIEDRVSPLLRVLASLVGDAVVTTPPMPKHTVLLEHRDVDTFVLRPSADLCAWASEVLSRIDSAVPGPVDCSCSGARLFCSHQDCPRYPAKGLPR